ncbi:MAG: PhoPQ-activated protein PqaA family protein, partial [Acidobacteriota bacterium]
MRRTALNLLVLTLFAVVAFAQQTALDRYIAKPDPSYQWKLLKTIPGEGYQTFVLELTSQTWRNAVRTSAKPGPSGSGRSRAATVLADPW